MTSPPIQSTAWKHQITVIAQSWSNQNCSGDYWRGQYWYERRDFHSSPTAMLPDISVKSLQNIETHTEWPNSWGTISGFGIRLRTRGVPRSCYRKFHHLLGHWNETRPRSACHGMKAIIAIQFKNKMSPLQTFPIGSSKRFQNVDELVPLWNESNDPTRRRLHGSWLEALPDVCRCM